MKTIHFLLVTHAASILANVCITFPKLADDLLHLGIYSEIVKVLSEILPLPASRVIDLEKANAVEKLFALLVNLQAKRSGKLLPYMGEEDDDRTAYALNEAVNLTVHFTQMSSHESSRSVCLFLRNLLQDNRAHRTFFSNPQHLQFILHAFYDLAQCQESAVSDAVALDWMSAISFISYQCDDFKNVFVEYHCPDCILIILQSRRPISLPLQMECIKALSFLSANEEICEHLLRNTKAISVGAEVFLSFDASGAGGIGLSRPQKTLLRSSDSAVTNSLEVNPPQKDSRGSGNFSLGNLPRSRDDPDCMYMKFSVNLLANLTFGSPDLLAELIQNDCLIQRIASLLEEGDRIPPFIQVKLVTILHNLMCHKEGRRRVASVPKIKDVFRSQMSSTNKTLRDIVSRCLTELRDEKKSTDDDSDRRVSKMHNKRGKVIAELIQTERTYVDNLLQMVALFLRFKVITQESKHRIEMENGRLS